MSSWIGFNWIGVDWLNWDFWQHHILLLMFTSAFLSATLLPGNSELVFVGFTTPKLMLGSLFSMDILSLLFVATLGNGLGSLTTYWIGRWFPRIDFQQAKTKWVVAKLEQYGVVALLLSWLPIIGDLFCAVAGWLRLNALHSAIFIFVGKLVRYILLLFFSLPWVF